MSSSEERAVIDGFGTSHVHVWHHVPRCSDELFTGNRKFRKPNWQSWRGGKINASIVQTIKSKIDQIAPHPHVVVLVFGGNNIADGQHPNEFYPFFEQVVAHANNMENVHVVISGIIPRPRTEETKKELYKQASAMLNNLCRENAAKCSFVNIANKLCRNGEICREFYAGPEDLQVHLNYKGAKVFAKAIYNVIRSIPKGTFN